MNSIKLFLLAIGEIALAIPALYFNQIWAQNLFYFLVGLNGLTVFMHFVSEEAKGILCKDAADKPFWYKRAATLFDFATVFLLAANGWFWCAWILFFSACLFLNARFPDKE